MVSIIPEDELALIATEGDMVDRPFKTNSGTPGHAPIGPEPAGDVKIEDSGAVTGVIDAHSINQASRDVLIEAGGANAEILEA